MSECIHLFPTLWGPYDLDSTIADTSYFDPRDLDKMRMGGVSWLIRGPLPRVTHTDALFTDQSQSILWVNLGESGRRPPSGVAENGWVLVIKLGFASSPCRVGPGNCTPSLSQIRS